MDKTYKVELLNVYEVAGGQEKRIAQVAVYEGLSYENLVELEQAITEPVAAALLRLGNETVQRKKTKKR